MTDATEEQREAALVAAALRMQEFAALRNRARRALLARQPAAAIPCDMEGIARELRSVLSLMPPAVSRATVKAPPLPDAPPPALLAEQINLWNAVERATAHPARDAPTAAAPSRAADEPLDVVLRHLNARIAAASRQQLAAFAARGGPDTQAGGSSAGAAPVVDSAGDSAGGVASPFLSPTALVDHISGAFAATIAVGGEIGGEGGSGNRGQDSPLPAASLAALGSLALTPDVEWSLIAQDVRHVQLALSFLAPQRPQCGIDDAFCSRAVAQCEAEQHAMTTRPLALRSHLFSHAAAPTADIAAFALQGLPAALRRDAYLRLMRAPIARVESRPIVKFAIRFAGGEVEAAGTKAACRRSCGGGGCVMGQALLADAQRFLGDDDQYFVFLETICAALELRAERETLPATVGFAGMTMRYGPLAFLTTDVRELALLMDGFDRCVWGRLINGATGAVTAAAVRMLAEFEELLSALAPVANYHMRRLGADPLRIAAPWLLTGFASVLSPPDVLALWDRLLGLVAGAGAAADEEGSVRMGLLLAACAAAAFAMRQHDVVRCSLASQVCDVFGDMEKLPILALVQHFLWPPDA